MKQKDNLEIAHNYMSRSIYSNYKRTMEEKNLMRKKAGLTPIPIRSYEQWSGRTAMKQRGEKI